MSLPEATQQPSIARWLPHGILFPVALRRRPTVKLTVLASRPHKPPEQSKAGGDPTGGQVGLMMFDSLTIARQLTEAGIERA